MEQAVKILNGLTPEAIAQIQKLAATPDQLTPGKVKEIICGNRKHKIQPNEKCPCGSGKKYKKCCFLEKK